MLRQPGKGFGRRIGLSGDMRSRGGVFQHGEVGVIGACQGVFPQTTDTEIRQAETFTFGHIDSCVKVYQVSGGAMSLVTCF